jgi:CBS domain containing-hemolysin-like protein
MSAEAMLIAVIVGFVLVFIGSLGTAAVQEVAWHELKALCRRRRRRDRFDQIHDNHDEIALGLDTLRTLGFFIVAVGAAGWSVKRLQVETMGLDSQADWWPGAAIALLVLLTAAVWMPRAAVQLWAEAILFYFWRLFVTAHNLVRPISAVTQFVEGFLRRLAARSEEEEDKEEAFEEEVLTIVTEGLHDGHLEADAREMIEGIMELGDADVADVMTPRSEMDALEVGMPWDEALKFVIDVGHTRIPVYQEKLDNILGILFVKDLLSELGKNDPAKRRPLRELLREAWSVPTTRKLDDLLRDFLKTRNHLAIVTDEFTAVAGIVTIEDVIEEIVGEIVDETDDEQIGEIRPIDDQAAEILGRAHLTEINDQLGIDLPEPDDFDTIGGLVTSRLGRIPLVGETIEIDGMYITVLEASPRKVERVKLKTPRPINQEPA